MDINQNQQINTFLKGMNTDTSDMLLSSDLYRFARNVRVITDTGSNSGELRIVDGNTEILVPEIHGTLLAMDNIRDLVVFIVKEGELQWSVYTYKKGRTPKEVLKVLTCTDKKIWNDDLKKNVSIVLRWESDNNIKLYIADGINPLMAILINKEHTNTDFKSLFGYYSITLPAPIVEPSYGGQVPAATVSYAYRLYSENKGASTMSAISSQVSLYDDQSHGFAPERDSNKSVEVTISNLTSSALNRILLYRINYILNGHEPEITLVADREFDTDSITITDYGNVSLETISAAEFLSLYNTEVTPTTIESKGDYLFLAGNSYSEDSVNKDFDKIDVRCFSLGNYLNLNNELVSILEISGNDVNINEVEDKNLKHSSFDIKDGSRYVWNSNAWGLIGNTGYNGIGKYFAWKYILKDAHTVTPKNQEGCRSYRRGEVYRFGVRLFNSDGDATSVKWMCDILMPPMFETLPGNTVDYPGIIVENGTITVRELGIQFSPINKDDDLWKKVAAYEIVQCRRSLVDSFVLSQGIGSKVMNVYTYNSGGSIEDAKILQPSGFFTMNTYSADCSRIDGNGHGRTAYLAKPSLDVLMFASPEYVYQPDDMKDVIKHYKQNIVIEDVVAYKPLSDVAPNAVSGAIRRYSDDFNIVDLQKLSEIHTNEDGVYDLSDAQSVITTSLGVKTRLLNSETPSYYIGFLDNSSHDLQNGYHYNIITLTYNNTFDIFGWLYLDDDYNKLCWYSTTVVSSTHLNSELISIPRSPDENYYTTRNYGKTAHYLNYFYPESHIINFSRAAELVNEEDYDAPKYEVKDVAYAESPEYSDFIKERNISILKNTTAIANRSFINWASPFMGVLAKGGDWGSMAANIMSNIHLGEGIPYINDDDDDVWPKSGLLYPTGSGGSCVLFEVNDLREYEYSFDRQHAPYINVQNIVKKAVPYGGYDVQHIADSTYISVGGYSNSDDDVDLFAGDVFIKIFTYNASHEWYDSEFKNFIKMASIYAVPLETSIDILALFSKSLYNVDTTERYVQDKASTFDEYVQNTDAYLYNTAYNTVLDIKTWYPDLTTEGSSNNFDTRIHFSERKINNEKIDNWLQYRSSNFLDVDSRYGKITAINLFKDRLMFWQEHAFGLLSVNERILINDTNDTQLQLGTGGVLERFDYVSQVYGMKKNQQSYAQSDSALYWWDGNNKEILQYGQGLAPLSTLKQIKNYLNEGTESTLPTILYDDKYKEVVCNVVNNESIAYNEQTQAFTSVYDENVQFWCNALGVIYECEQIMNNGVYLHNTNNGAVEFFGNNEVKPHIKYVVNKDSTSVKTFDIQTFGGRFYGGEMENLANLQFDYYTPLKQHSSMRGGENTTDKRRMTNLEYDYRLTIPRNGADFDNKKDWGDRMRGKTMQCEIRSDSNSTDFSLQYVITKFRMSWT